MKLGETITIAVLKKCPSVGASLYSLHLPSHCFGRAGFDMNTSHIFPHGMLTSITLVEGVPGDEAARTSARCEAGLPLCSVSVIALLEVGIVVLNCRRRSPDRWIQVCSVSFKFVLSLLPIHVPLSQSGAVLEHEVPGM